MGLGQVLEIAKAANAFQFFATAGRYKASFALDTTTANSSRRVGYTGLGIGSVLLRFFAHGLARYRRPTFQASKVGKVGGEIKNGIIKRAKPRKSVRNYVGSRHKKMEKARGR